MKRFLFAFGVLLVSLITAVQGAQKTEVPVGGVDKLNDGGFVYVDSVEEYDPSMSVSLYSRVPDWLDDGSRDVYKSLVSEENGELKQELYNRIYTAMYAFTYDSFAKTTEYTAGDGTTARYLCVRVTDGYDTIGWSEIFKIYHGVLEDNPQFFYISGGGQGFGANGNAYLGMGIPEEYLDVEGRIAEVDAITEGIAGYDDIIDSSMSNYAIEKKVHDKLILDNNYSYDEQGNPSTGRFAHSIAGSLNKKYGGGVCESYSKTMDLLMNRYDVPCFYAAGTANGGGHAWNYIQLDNGNWYCVDATWDDTKISGTDIHILRYTYFNMPGSDFHANRVVGGDYMAYESLLPQCSDGKEYYTSNPSLRVGVASNGDYIYKAPDVSEEETRTFTTLEETSTETTTAKTYEYTTEVTTCNLQPIADSSPKKIILSKDSGSWLSTHFSSGQAVAWLREGSGEISLVTQGECSLSYIVQLNNCSVKVFVDGEQTKSYSTTKGDTVWIPQGLHKVSWVYEVTADGGDGMLYSVKAVDKGDINGNGSVDMEDAIAMLDFDAAPGGTDVYGDMNGDGIIGGADIALILRKICGV